MVLCQWPVCPVGDTDGLSKQRERERERAAHYSTSQTEVRTLRLGVERQSDEETGEREDDRFVL